MVNLCDVCMTEICFSVSSLHLCLLSVSAVDVSVGWTTRGDSLALPCHPLVIPRFSDHSYMSAMGYRTLRARVAYCDLRARRVYCGMVRPTAPSVPRQTGSAPQVAVTRIVVWYGPVGPR